MIVGDDEMMMMMMTKDIARFNFTLLVRRGDWSSRGTSVEKSEKTLLALGLRDGINLNKY